MEKAILKEHWDRLRREDEGDGDEQGNQVEMTEDEKKEWEELCEEIEMKSQTVYDCDTKTLDFSKMKATDGKANKRVFFPRGEYLSLFPVISTGKSFPFLSVLGRVCPFSTPRVLS